MKIDYLSSKRLSTAHVPVMGFDCGYFYCPYIPMPANSLKKQTLPSKTKIWVSYVDRWGNGGQYSVSNWGAAQDEAVRWITDNIRTCSFDGQAQIYNVLNDDWREALRIFNETNSMNMSVKFRVNEPFDDVPAGGAG